MNTEPIDYADEARLLAVLRECGDRSRYEDRRLAAAQVYATLALAEEQRTANLIALAAQVETDDRAARDLAERIVVRLGPWQKAAS